MKKPIFHLLITAFAPVLLHAQSEFKKQPERKVDLEKDKNLYVVGYAHLDTQWRWAYPQVIREFVPNTMRQNFPLFDKYPNYVFNFTGSRRYEFMKEYYPEDYAQVKEWVAKGRWFPAGSSVDENDAIVPGLESYVRHALYGNHFFDREFGVHSEEFMLPDCFGFPYALPSLLAHNGIKGFITQKLTWKSANGIPFKVGTWEGPDGKSVFAALDAGDYTGKLHEDLSQSERWLNRINDAGAKSGLYTDFLFHGDGDRGGTPGEKSAEWLERSLAGNGPVHVIAAKSDQIFKDITPAQREKLPHYKGELLLIEHSAGSITSQAYMKRWNRKNELLANAAESAASQAFLLGGLPYPHQTLYRAWDLVLGSQMHDILPGTSLPKAYEYSWSDEVLALNQFASVLESSVAAVASKLDTSAHGVPLVVYNPLSIQREDPVEATVPWTGGEVVTVFGPDGKAVPTQIISRGKGEATILFLARVPGLSFSVFDVRSVADETTNSLKISENNLENHRYRVSLDSNGDVASLYDKQASRELLQSPARLSFQYENPEQYPAWNMDWNDRQKPPIDYVEGPAKIRIVESGPVRVSLEVTRQSRGSTFIQEIRLAAGEAGDRVEFANRIDWRTQGVSLKAAFPLSVANPSATYDAQIGTVSRTNNRPTQFEVPQHQWLDLTDAKGDYGVAVLNDSKFGSDKPDDNTVRLTLLYTPHVRNEFQDQASQDIGRHDILYALSGHNGDWGNGLVPLAASRLNQPLYVFRTVSHAGPLGKTYAPVRLNSEQVKIAAVKIAEDTDELIVRLIESTGHPAQGLQLNFAEKILSVREVDGQERQIAEVPLKKGKLQFDLTSYAVKAFAIKLAKAPESIAPVESTPIKLPYDLDAISSDKSRADGDFNGEGETYPAEQLPPSIQREGLSFQLGSSKDGDKNAVLSKGQKIDLPAGNYNRVYLLASSAKNDIATAVQIGERSEAFTVQSWKGYIGQWDNRIWGGDVPELTYTWNNPWVGLEPGYIKKAPVAWFATHFHQPTTNTFYHFSYLYKYGFDLPKETTSITLPDNDQVRIFAITVANEPGAGTVPAAPLHDTLDAHQYVSGGLPEIQGGDKNYDDITAISITPPLYFRENDLRYTLDGTDPTANSATYTRPIEINRELTLKVRQLMPDGPLGPVASATIRVNDKKPPLLRSAVAYDDRIVVIFSEPVSEKSATNPANYQLDSGLKISRADVSEDRRAVTLVLAGALPTDKKVTLKVANVADSSPSGNLLVATTSTVSANQVYRLDYAKVPEQAVTLETDTLPLKKADSWTIHAFVKPSETPAKLTLLAGFGTASDKKAQDGQGRFLAVFEDGIRFWARARDVVTNSPIEVGRWQLISAVYDGKTVSLYKDGQIIGEKEIALADDKEGKILVAPVDAWDGKNRLMGEVSAVTILRRSSSSTEIRDYFKKNLPQAQ